MSTSRPATEISARAAFLVRQPIYRLAETDPARRWTAVVNESEPADESPERERLEAAFRPPQPEGVAEVAFTWKRLERTQLVTNVAGLHQDWRRVLLVCGAGLGKTTNLQWLEYAINARAVRGGKQIAFFLELEHLTGKADDLLNDFVRRVANNQDISELRVRRTLQRLRAEGRITLLLDSLDQAGPDPRGKTVHALLELLQPGNLWAACPLWVSGRPYAFDQAAALFHGADFPSWQVLRVGLLDEPEARFLLGKVEASSAAMQQY